MSLLSLDTLLKLAEQGHFHREHNHDGGNCEPCAMLIGCLADLRTLESAPAPRAPEARDPRICETCKHRELAEEQEPCKSCWEAATDDFPEWAPREAREPEPAPPGAASVQEGEERCARCGHSEKRHGIQSCHGNPMCTCSGFLAEAERAGCICGVIGIGAQHSAACIMGARPSHRGGGSEP